MCKKLEFLGEWKKTHVNSTQKNWNQTSKLLILL